MHRHFRLGLCLVWVCLCASGGAESAFAAAKPNIIVILSDDGAYSDFGFSAALNNVPTQVQTPNLDALAQRSAVARQGYASVSVCSPARAGLLTGIYPQQFGYEDNINESSLSSTQGLPGSQVTIAERLKPLGYSTGAIGKWHVGMLQGSNRPLDQGFDEFYGMLGGSRDNYYDLNVGRAIWKDNQFYENQYRQEGDPSKYDPSRGRYVTDAFGEEAVSFINRHAQNENPFFLYLAYTAPHTPYQAKQEDLARFSHITDPTKQAIAAMTYAMDRSIGEVMGSLTANGIDDNTIVVFANDQGAPSWVPNAPFRGFKGTAWEGGIRVPMLIKGPGIDPGVYDSPITFYDMLPTMVSAAGGDISQFEHDGYDVMPFLKGDATDDPNKVRFWRHYDSFAVRKGDWKLTRAYLDAGPVPWLFNVKSDPTESVYLMPSRPDKVAELGRELTNWEATLGKPKWGAIGSLNQNTFDHFVFRNNVAATANWSSANGWTQHDNTSLATLKPADAYANAVLEFRTRNDADYTATNDMKRMTGYTFMLNQLKLTGSFASSTSRQATLNGNALLFVKSLNGNLPRIDLDVTSGGSAGYKFQVDNEIQLLHDLEISGNGTQQFVIGGAIRDYYEPQQPTITTPHSVRKSGTSKVTLRGNSTFAGALIVAEGEVALAGPSAAINGATSIVVEDGGRFNLQEGRVKTPLMYVAPNGSFDVNGGRLETESVIGDLVVNQGTFAPGFSTAITTISGSFALNGGRLQLDLGGANVGTGYDQLQVGGTALITGGLQVQFVSGFTPVLYQNFEILTAEQLTGTFSSYSLPALPGGMGWRAIYTTQGVTLSVRPPGDTNTVFPTGDYNFNGIVDAADYTIWRDTLGSTTDFRADGNGDHVIDQLDYAIWKTHRGQVFSGMASIEVTGGVPEPDCMVLALIGILAGKLENDFARRARKRAIRALDLPQLV